MFSNCKEHARGKQSLSTALFRLHLFICKYVCLLHKQQSGVYTDGGQSLSGCAVQRFVVLISVKNDQCMLATTQSCCCRRHRRPPAPYTFQLSPQRLYLLSDWLIHTVFEGLRFRAETGFWPLAQIWCSDVCPVHQPPSIS